MKAFVSVTDQDWCDYLQSQRAVDEVNSWQPGGKRLFDLLSVGEPLELVGRRYWQTFFRLEFAGGSTRLSVQQVWTPPSPLAWLHVKLSPHRNVAGRLDSMVQNLRTTLVR